MTSCLCPHHMDISDHAKLSFLPDDILNQLDKLVVNRKGSDHTAYMVTEQIISHASPGQLYSLEWNGLKPVNQEKQLPLPDPTIPPFVQVTGVWQTEEETGMSVAGNILGGYGSLTVEGKEREIQIPVAPTTAENLAFYGCRLVKVGEVVEFESTGNLPVTITSVGETYVEKFLMVEECGGGAYVEYHDRPHFHMPLNKDAGGFLVLGLLDKPGFYKFSGFEIQYGYAISMAPYTIHTDAYLVGKYLVII